MAKTAKIRPPKMPDSVDLTYDLGGQVQTLAEMLAMTTKCGQQRFVLLSATLNQPVGTLADKLNPLRHVLSVQVQLYQTEVKRVQEGHKYQPAKELVLR